jgi:hypothetical protein
MSLSIDSLRSCGAALADPVGFRYLEALDARIAHQPQAVRQLLQQKLDAAVADYADRVARKTVAQPRAAACTTPLAHLNEHVRRIAEARQPPAQDDEPQDPRELASARRFRQAWARHRTLDEVDRAVSRKPANAGPLNSHVLMLHSLHLMRMLSPSYLRRFLVYAESLQWLEQAREKYVVHPAKDSAAAKAARRGRRKS